MNRVLWVVQFLLAALFMFAGVMKFVMPVEEMTKQMPSMSGGFLHFIGAAEVLGGIGLVVPWLTRIRPALTPLAAGCLFLIMVGAVWTTASTGPLSMAALPFVTGLLCAFVAWGRRSGVPA